jgi:hypothetical protein
VVGDEDVANRGDDQFRFVSGNVVIAARSHRLFTHSRERDERRLISRVLILPHPTVGRRIVCGDQAHTENDVESWLCL